MSQTTKTDKRKNKKKTSKKKDSGEPTPPVYVKSMKDILDNPKAPWGINTNAVLYDISATIEAIRKFNGEAQAVINQHGEKLGELLGDNVDADSMENPEAETGREEESKEGV